MMEDALYKSDVAPTDQQPTLDIERFIQGLGVHMDQHADLDPTVLGLTEFYTDGPPRILINRDLTGAIDDEQTPPGFRGRWRATMAHEASHVLMHHVLFQVNQDQENLFRMEEKAGPQLLMRCLKKDVLFRSEGVKDWREVQANMGMAALRMPQGVFRRLAVKVAEQYCFSTDALCIGSKAAATVAVEMAALLDVSKQAARIRLETLGILSPAGQPWLIRDVG